MTEKIIGVRITADGRALPLMAKESANALGGLTVVIERAGGASRKAGQELSGFRGVLVDMRNDAVRTAASMTPMPGLFDSMAQRLGPFGVAAGLAAGGLTAIALGARELANSRIEVERFQFASAALGSTNAETAEEMAYLSDLARRYGRDLGALRDGYISLTAASRGTRIEGEATRAIFESVVKSTAALGLGVEQTRGILLSLQQMMSKGTVQSEELRGQLGERLPGAFQIAARAMGVTTAELGKMLEQGEVISDEFLPKFAAQLNKELAGGAEAAADSVQASTTRMSNAWKELKESVAEAGVADAWKGAIDLITGAAEGLTAALKSAKEEGRGFTDWLTSSMPTLGLGIKALQQYRALSNSEDYLRGRQRDIEQQLQSGGGGFYQQGTLQNELADVNRRLGPVASRDALARGEYQDSSGELNVAAQEAAYQAELAARAKYLAERKAQGDKLAEALAAENKAYADALATTRGNMAAAAEVERAHLAKVAEIRDKLGDKKKGKAEKAEDYQADRQAVLLEAEFAKVRKFSSDAAKEQEKAEAALRKEREQSGKVAEREAERLEDQLQREREEAENIGKTTAELAQLTIQRAEAAAMVKEQELASRALAGATDEELAAIQRQIDALRALGQARAESMISKEQTEAAKQLAEEMQRDIEERSEAISNTIEQALMRGFESGSGFAENFVDTVENYLKTQTLKIAVQPVVNAATGVINAVMGAMGGGGAGGGGGGFGGLSSLGQYGSMISSIGEYASSIGAWLGFGSSAAAGTGTAAASGVLTNSAGLTYAAQGSAGFGSTIAGNGGLAYSSISGAGVGGVSGSGGVAAGGSSFASAIPIIGWIMAGMTASNALYNQGYEWQSDNDWKDPTQSFNRSILTGLGLSDSTANIITGGAVQQYLFGSSQERVTGAGLDLNYGGGEAGGRQYVSKEKKGGLFTSTRRWEDYSALDSGFSGGLNSMLDLVESGMTQLGEQIGLSTTGMISSVSSSVRIATGNRSEADISADINNWIGGINDSMTRAMLANNGISEAAIASMGLKDEKISATLIRLADQMAHVDHVAEMLSVQFSATGLAGLQAADDLAKMFGGAAGFDTAGTAYVQAIWTDAQRLDMAKQQLASAFAGINTAIPSSREAYKALVESQNLSTEAGRELFAALVQLAPAFAQVTDASAAMAEASAAAAEAMAQQVASVRDSLVGGISRMYQSERASALATRDEYAGYATGLRNYGGQLSLAANDSPESRYQALQAQFQDYANRAGLGDASALSGLQGVASQYLDASRTYNASGAGYQADLANVQAVVGNGADVAQRNADAAQRQADSLREMVEQVLKLNDTAVTLADLLAQLRDLDAAGTSATVNQLELVRESLDRVERRLAAAA